MKTWITIPASALDSVDFAELRNTSANSTPKNIVGDTALVKWIGDMPSSVANIEGKGAELDHAGALALLATEAWTDSEVI